MMLVDVIRDHFRFLFANHRNQHCIIAVLNKMENWLEEDKGLRWSMETGCQVWKIDRIHAGVQAAWIQKSRVTRTVDCTLMLQGSMPPHFSHSSPQALNCPELLPCLAHAHILTAVTSHLLCSETSDAARVLASFVIWSNTVYNETILTSGINYKFKEFPRYPEFS